MQCIIIQNIITVFADDFYFHCCCIVLCGSKVVRQNHVFNMSLIFLSVKRFKVNSTKINMTVKLFKLAPSFSSDEASDIA